MLHPRLLTTLLAVLITGLAAGAEPEPTPDQVRFFESQVRPVLVNECSKCHGAGKSKAGLRVDSRASLLAGGDSGPAVVPGKPEESLLVEAIRYEGPEMPPTGKLPAPKVEALTRWVQMGAPWPAGESVPAAPARKAEFQITDKDRKHWAFQPVVSPKVPSVNDRAWVTNPIDAFILARLEARGLTPNPPASRQELIRRATYDLTGLPPTPGEVDAFLADTRPDAYERLVDRLLDSPRYGEKWGRHWLDLVRFAETNSYERDAPKPSAWRYRDYVIRAFNEDRPYDHFVREQLAGDELPDGGDDALIATGYYRLGIWDDEPTDREQARFDGLDDIVATTAQVFLGLTVDCARCHDHKIDPIPQKDYYRLVAFFANINHYRNGGPTDEAPLLPDPDARRAYWQAVRERDRQRAAVQVEIKEIEAIFRQLYEPAHGGRTISSPQDLARLIRAEGPTILGPERFERYRQLRRDLAQLREAKTTAETALCVTERGPRAPETFVLARGNPHAPGDRVEPGFLSVLGTPSPSLPTPPPGAKTSGRRTVLADWIASPDNPLTARVLVNRLWQHHFGRGIVRSPSNFGTQGDPPTHPELLDWLAAEFLKQGWRLKPLHRLIMTSNAYRMSSRARPEGLSQDPANDLFWRFDMRRLTAEEVRDSILAVSGTLSLKMYGPGFFSEIPPEVLAGQSVPGKGWGTSPPDEAGRRSVYIHVKRSLLTPILESFDVAEVDRSSPVRFATTQPTQALALLNSAFLNKQAAAFAARLRREAGDDPRSQVERALRLATARAPGGAEVQRGVDLIASLRTRDGLNDEEALRSFCLVVLNLDEFIYLD